jgi:hypothetical protein
MWNPTATNQIRWQSENVVEVPMVHDTIVKAWAVLIQRGSINACSDHRRRTSRRFAPQLGLNALESRMVLSTITVTLIDTPGPDDLPTAAVSLMVQDADALMA